MGMTFETWLETERARYGNVRFSAAEKSRLERAWDAAILSTKDSTMTSCIGTGGGAAEANAKHIAETLGRSAGADAKGPHGQKNVVYSKVDRPQEEASEECVVHSDTNLRVKKTAMDVTSIGTVDHFGYGYLRRNACED